MANSRAYVAEFLGTFFLCFAGIAAILSGTAAVGGGGGLVAIALAHGLALSVAVNAFGGISGAHFNPAVTIAMAVTGRIGPAAAGVYILVQLAAATAAAALCRAIYPPEAVAQALLGIPLPAQWVSTGTLIVTEIVLTFLLVIAIFGTAVDERGKAVKIGAFGIGFTVAFNILAAGAVTGASMNPARSFGPALVLGVWNFHIYYWIAPIVGAVLGAVLYDRVLLDRRP
ncbi:MAG: aquaporin [Acidobacteriota bacterium]|nr:aquaporin [Acidobacteriota bacterium]